MSHKAVHVHLSMSLPLHGVKGRWPGLPPPDTLLNKAANPCLLKPLLLGFSYLQWSGVRRHTEPGRGAQSNARGVFKKCLKGEGEATR